MNRGRAFAFVSADRPLFAFRPLLRTHTREFVISTVVSHLATVKNIGVSEHWTPAASEALNRWRNGRTTAPAFDNRPWLTALEASDLHPADKQTARHLAEAANTAGQSHITRAALSARAGVSREATISARLERLRDAGFITTTPRFRQAPCHQLTTPPPAALTAALRNVGRTLETAA